MNAVLMKIHNYPLSSWNEPNTVASGGHLCILILKIESWLAKMTLHVLPKGYSKKRGIYIKTERKKHIAVFIHYRSFLGRHDWIFVKLM